MEIEARSRVLGGAGLFGGGGYGYGGYGGAGYGQAQEVNRLDQVRETWVRKLLVASPLERLTAMDAMEHAWLSIG